MTKEEDELLWVKLQGDWGIANFRFKMAEEGKCLGVLIHDVNTAVKQAAVKKRLEQIMDGVRRL